MFRVLTNLPRNESPFRTHDFLFSNDTFEIRLDSALNWMPRERERAKRKKKFVQNNRNEIYVYKQRKMTNCKHEEKSPNLADFWKECLHWLQNHHQRANSDVCRFKVKLARSVCVYVFWGASWMVCAMIYYVKLDVFYHLWMGNAKEEAITNEIFCMCIHCLNPEVYCEHQNLFFQTSNSAQNT